jgi:predicted nuclease of predicted toxin-antitoxin system
MKILLDECVTKRLKNHLTEFDVFTVRELNLGGIKNGKLMTYCAENNFDLLLTIDKNLMYQQNLEKYPVTIAVLNCFTSKIEELITFLPSFKLQADKLEKHQAYIIDK